MKQRWFFPAILGAALLGLANLCAAQAVPRSEFGWWARLELPSDASLARVRLPPEALLQLQSSDARDVRVFNASGHSVPFAVMPVPEAPAAATSFTRAYPALAMQTWSAAPGRARGSAQVRIEDRGRSVWVQLNGPTPTDSGMKTALFATRGEQQPLKAISVQATLPPNTPVQILVSTSADLAQWTRVPVLGRLYRFEGEGAPSNNTLEFEKPMRLEGRYLRLDWNAQEAVAITGVIGVVAPPAAAPQRVRAPMPTPQPAGKRALEIGSGFLTPMAAIALSTAKENTLLPVRILGRNDAAQPWQPLANTVVYRLGRGADEGTNPPVALNGWSGRWLRIESTGGADLGSERIQAEAEFAPIQLVFVATGAAPFDLAFGHPGAPAEAVPLATIASALGGRKLEELPEAKVGAAVRQERAKSPLFGWVSSTTPDTPAVLWGVLLLGVLILAWVAWSLLRKLKSGRPEA